MMRGPSPRAVIGLTAPLPAQIDVLDLRVAQYFLEALFFADAALLPAAIGRADIAPVGIDPDISRLDPFRRLHRGREIVGHDGGGEAIFQAVHLLDHVFVIVPGHHRHHRAEYFLAADPHRRRHAI